MLRLAAQQQLEREQTGSKSAELNVGMIFFRQNHGARI
jgi:hypothetical protein